VRNKPTKKIDIYTKTEGSSWLFTTLKQTAEFFASKLAEVPPEFQDVAVCDISSSSDSWGGSDLEIEIYYYRPMTDEEMAHSKDEARRYREQHALAMEMTERAEFERLKAKFMPSASSPDVSS